MLSILIMSPPTFARQGKERLTARVSAGPVPFPRACTGWHWFSETTVTFAHPASFYY
jgi:hypothetical protein